jgi:hypothetical protein
VEYTPEEQRVIDWYVKELDGRPIICLTQIPRKIGEFMDDKVKRIDAPWGGFVIVKAPMVVTRECTFEEWQASLPAGSPGLKETRATAEKYGIRFYELSVD